MSIDPNRHFNLRGRIISMAWLAGVLFLVASHPPAYAVAAVEPATYSLETRPTSDEARIIRRFKTYEPVLTLSFDTETVAGYEDKILDILAAKDVRVTFAVTGMWASEHRDTLRRMVREGHHFMSHSWSHPRFTKLTPEERKEEMRRTEDVVRTLTGVELQPYFRPPYGDRNDEVLADMAAIGYTVNTWWSIDSRGWRGIPASEIVEHVLDEAFPGALILLHSGPASHDVEALPTIIDHLRAQGYHFATVTDMDVATLPGADPYYFPETGYHVRGDFLHYWNDQGALAIFGFPISKEFEENGYTVQYFQRARLERHPENTAPYQVLRGQVGRELMRGRENERAFQAATPATTAGCTFYSETQHNVCDEFQAYWQAHGALPAFGYPLSEVFEENGRSVQYFERARFEYHPEAPEPFKVSLGHLGLARYANRQK